MENDDQQPLNLQSARKLFENTDDYRERVGKKYEESHKYYVNRGDITNKTKEDLDKEKKDEKRNPLRNFDSRVPSNFHQLLVDQKVSYVGSITPDIDTGDDKANKVINDTLGDDWNRLLQKLMIDASLCGVGWLHAWQKDGQLKLAVVPPDQITPIYNDYINREVIAVRRTYKDLDTTDGEYYIHDEYWTENEAQFFKYKSTEGYDGLTEDNKATVYDVNSPEDVTATNVYRHDFGAVPFVPFMNNSEHLPDLVKYKGLIDTYDLVYNGFVNDIQDVQQVVLVLTNYGGTNLNEFMNTLRYDKAIKIDDDGDGSHSGVETLQIDIPVEARNSLLEKTMDSIFFQGQGVNPAKLEMGTNLTGVAMKMMYGQLELKAGVLEAEFRIGISKLVNIILSTHGIDPAKFVIKQSWTRAAIQNSSEQADIISKVANVSSAEAIAKNNPIVSDWQEEVDRRQEENAGSDQFAPDK